MKMIAIRGAITVSHNTKEEIISSAKTLIEAVIKENNIKIDDIIEILFTATRDLTAAYPAVGARELGITQAALMCMQEMYVEGSLPMCIRLSMHVQSNSLTQENINHQYLKEAAKLRPDLSVARENVKNRFSLAIDGPAGAGKSTIAKELAKRLNCIYIDTGAMYRAVGLYCMLKGIDYSLEEAVNKVMEDIKIDIKYIEGAQNIYLNEQDVSLAIRTQEVALAASKVATYIRVREALVRMQRNMQKATSVVMDGRDIGTVVLPDATLKIFLTASPVERAKRRCLEYTQKGLTANYAEILKEIEERDFQDSNREVSPLKKAEDAIEIDTTSLTIENIIERIMTLLEERKN